MIQIRRGTRVENCRFKSQSVGLRFAQPWAVARFQRPRFLIAFARDGIVALPSRKQFRPPTASIKKLWFSFVPSLAWGSFMPLVSSWIILVKSEKKWNCFAVLLLQGPCALWPCALLYWQRIEHEASARSWASGDQKTDGAAAISLPVERTASLSILGAGLSAPPILWKFQ